MAKFTEQRLQAAKDVNLEWLLRSRGETLKPSGGEYRWMYRDGAGEHDSVTIRGNRWFDHKNQVGGDPIGFLQRFQGLSFREAVVQLTIESGEWTRKGSAHADDFKQGTAEKKIFVPPSRNENMRRLYAYLCKGRKIPHELVTHFVHAGVLYEDAKYHNAVFLAADERGKSVGGTKKGTLSDSRFRQTIEGSNTRYAFHHKGHSGKVFVFEAAVDLLSFIALHPEEWQQHSYLALDGVSSKPLFHFLQAHSGINEVCLCLDNDSAGQKAAERIAAELQAQWSGAVLTFSSTEKDWNEELKSRQQTRCRDELMLSL